VTLSRSRCCAACQRSYWTCWLSQLSGVVSKAIANRIAISGLIPAWPFRMLDNVLRLTPKALAARVTDNPKGSRHSFLRISPGCGGLCIRIAFTSMIILIINICDIFADKSERDTPIPADLDGPSSLPIAAQFVEVQTRQIHISGLGDTETLNRPKTNRKRSACLAWMPDLMPLVKSFSKPLCLKLVITRTQCNLDRYKLQAVPRRRRHMRFLKHATFLENELQDFRSFRSLLWEDYHFLPSQGTATGHLSALPIIAPRKSRTCEAVTAP
jgi:hypothetical protein